MRNQSTEALIAEYDARMANRWVRCNAGTVRDAQRQRKLWDLIDEIGAHADNGDAVALAWLGES